MTKESRCRICGCTDNHACLYGCSWIWVDRKSGVGVCSSCGLVDAMAGAGKFLVEYAEVLENSYKVRGRWLADPESQAYKKDHDWMLGIAKIFRGA
ncbi:MAG TPA: hypothetical protein VFA75_10105, partial [Nevskia sp.]|nr:hypothetical protein [Nevskia sp.]